LKRHDPFQNLFHKFHFHIAEPEKPKGRQLGLTPKNAQLQNHRRKLFSTRLRRPTQTKQWSWQAGDAMDYILHFVKCKIPFWGCQFFFVIFPEKMFGLGASEISEVYTIMKGTYDRCS